MKEKIPVSIIIPTKNEQLHLPRLLESIENQTVQPVDIIVSDAGSKDGTVEIAKEHSVKVVKGGMPSVGRNKGAQQSSGEILLFMDADTYFLKENDLKEIYEKFQEGKYDIASCYFKTEESSIFTQGLLNFLKWFATRKYNPVLKSDFGAFLIIRKDPFDRVNGFNEELLMMEDTDIVQRLIRFGYVHGIINKKIGVSLSLEKRGKKKSLSWKMVLGVILGYFS
ncbi:MAG: glycosyltransferase, partial [Deferribacterota bacterium]|nr:glycosyltransferase [Deferribacterota bacterium]